MKSPRVWIIDPIDYTGLAYFDSALGSALCTLGTDVTLVGTDASLVRDRNHLLSHVECFRGTHGRRHFLRKGTAYLLSLARLLERARREKPDIVHWYYLEFAPADHLAQLALRALGIPQVYTAHEILPWNVKPYDRRLYRRIFAAMDAILVHNEDDGEELAANYGVDPPRIATIPLGNCESFAKPEMPQAVARAALGLPPQVPIALFFGSIRPSKGLEVLLQAWRSVVSLVPGATLVVTGKPYKGLDVSRFTALVSQTRLENHIRFRFEQVNPEEADRYYRAADVVVLPYDDIATSGTLRYAYSSARAVVATSVGEHRRWVEPGETGFLVPPRDPPALAAAIVELLDNRATAERMGRQALAYGRRNFDWLPIAQRTSGVYASVLAQRRNLHYGK